MKNQTELFLTGSKGIIGSYLYDELNNDFKVFKPNFMGDENRNNSESIDFTDKNQLETLVKKIKRFDILIFLIGLAHKKGKLNDF